MGSEKMEWNEKELIKFLKEFLLTPKPLDKRPTIAELEKILNSEDGGSLALLPNGEVACLNPKISIEGVARAILAQFSPKVGTTPIKYPENKEGYKVGVDMAAGWNMAIDEMKRLNG